LPTSPRPETTISQTRRCKVTEWATEMHYRL